MKGQIFNQFWVEDDFHILCNEVEDKRNASCSLKVGRLHMGYNPAFQQLIAYFLSKHDNTDLLHVIDKYDKI